MLKNEISNSGMEKNGMVVLKKEFSDRLAKNCGMTKLDAFIVVNAFWHTLLEFLADGYTVNFYGIGKFELKKMKGMKSSNLDGKTYLIPECSKVKFRPSKALKRKIKEL